MEDRIIPRQILNIVISLSDSRNISGELQIDLEMRLSDFMNLPGKFLVIKDKDGTIKIVNKDHIIDLRIV